MAYEKGAMTAFAQAALAASDLINAKFAGLRFTGNIVRTVKVEAPRTESTGGGKQARESIMLRSESDNPRENVTAGFLDVGLRACELRSYASLMMLHKQRFQQPLDLHQSEYDKFLGELKALLEQEGYVIKLIEPDEQQAKALAAQEPQGGSPMKMVGIAVGVLVVLGVVAAVAIVVMK